jgi:uncharacterized membrane protein
MTTSLIALFEDMEDVRDAMEELLKNGVASSDVSIMTNNVDDRYTDYIEGYDPDMTAEEGAVTGALFGTFTGIVLAMVPGIGPVLGLGTLLASAGIGAATGAVTGGLVAALIESGVDEDEANIYAEAVRRGGILVSVNAPDHREDDIEDILEDAGAIDVDDLGDYYRSTGWTTYDDTAPNYTGEQFREDRRQYKSYSMLNDKEFEPYVDRFRQHYDRYYNDTDYEWDAYIPAYYHGFYIASVGNNYAAAPEWHEVKADARREWEEDYDTPWENVAEAVREGWREVTGQDEDARIG